MKTLRSNYSRISLHELLTMIAEGISNEENAIVLVIVVEERFPSPAQLPLLNCLYES